MVGRFACLCLLFAAVVLGSDVVNSRLVVVVAAFTPVPFFVVWSPSVCRGCCGFALVGVRRPWKRGGGVFAIFTAAGVAPRELRAREICTPPLSVPQEIFEVDETAHVLRNLCAVVAHILGVLWVVTAHVLAKSMGRLFQRLFSVVF